MPADADYPVLCMCRPDDPAIDQRVISWRPFFFLIQPDFHDGGMGPGKGFAIGGRGIVLCILSHGMGSVLPIHELFFGKLANVLIENPGFQCGLCIHEYYILPSCDAFQREQGSADEQ